MSAPDMLEVINGPEDGTEFPISRAPVIVGLDLACDVHVRLDETIEEQHARLTAVSDGYRVRKIQGGRLAVDGKRTGVFRSRILRDGGILVVGNTEFCLRCGPNGLAKRSRGLPKESDFFWALRTMGARMLGLGKSGEARRPQSGFKRLTRTILIVFIAAAIAGFIWPDTLYQVRAHINAYVGLVGDRLADLISGRF